MDAKYKVHKSISDWKRWAVVGPEVVTQWFKSEEEAKKVAEELNQKFAKVGELAG